MDKIFKKTCALFIILFCSVNVYAADDCHPSIGLKNFLVGYGSLMDHESVKATVYNPSFIVPVSVKGFKRSFGLFVDAFGLKTSFLSVIKHDRHEINAVLIGLDEKGVKSMDAREKGYCRIRVPKENIYLYANLGEIDLDGDIWIYALHEEDKTVDQKAYVIAQSYIDLFVGGCLMLERQFKIPGFAKQCIRTTEDWGSKEVVNDRIYPRRPWVHQPLAMKIDKLLNTMVPEVIKHRRLEL